MPSRRELQPKKGGVIEEDMGDGGWIQFMRINCELSSSFVDTVIVGVFGLEKAAYLHQNKNRQTCSHLTLETRKLIEGDGNFQGGS